MKNDDRLVTCHECGGEYELTGSDYRDPQRPAFNYECRHCDRSLSIVELRAAEGRQPEQEAPPLWRHAVDECNAAHAELDRLGAVTTRTVLARDGDRKQPITLGLVDRIRSLKLAASVSRQQEPEKPETVSDFAAHNGVESLSWALDLLDMYDERLAAIDGAEQVYTAVHKFGKRKAREDLAALRALATALRIGDEVFEALAAHPEDVEAAAEGRQPEQEQPSLADAAEMLWVVLANVSGGDWSQQSPEWQEAAARWRDNYFASIKSRKS